MERTQRLRKGDEFDTAYREGTVVGGPLLVLRHLDRDTGTVRWGFAVGKRLARHAVDRNRAKRRLREAARQVSVPPGHDIILTARAGALTADFPTLKAAIERAVYRAGLRADSEPR